MLIVQFFSKIDLLFCDIFPSLQFDFSSGNISRKENTVSKTQVYKNMQSSLNEYLYL